jgi:hypothetical protein
MCRLVNLCVSFVCYCILREYCTTSILFFQGSDLYWWYIEKDTKVISFLAKINVTFSTAFILIIVNTHVTSSLKGPESNPSAQNLIMQKWKLKKLCMQTISSLAHYLLDMLQLFTNQSSIRNFFINPPVEFKWLKDVMVVVWNKTPKGNKALNNESLSTSRRWGQTTFQNALGTFSYLLT